MNQARDRAISDSIDILLTDIVERDCLRNVEIPVPGPPIRRQFAE